MNRILIFLIDNLDLCLNILRFKFEWIWFF
jgi:hypothetical protein